MSDWRTIAVVMAITTVFPGCGDDDDVTDADGDADADTDADSDADSDADGDADGDADADGDGDGDADVTNVYSFAGLGADARVEQVIHADGSESLRCRVLTEPRNYQPFTQRVLHEVELDPEGWLTSSSQSIALTIGTVEVEKRFVFDREAGEMRITRPAGAFRVPVETDLPVLPSASASQVFINEPSFTPCGAWTRLRAQATGLDVRLVLVDLGEDFVIPAEEVVLDGLTWDDRFVATLDGPNTGTWERFDEDFGDLFEDFTVAEAADFTPAVDCEVGGVAEEFVAPSTDGGEVHGTINLPDGAGPFPFVVITEGSPGGPRDGKALRCVAQHLVAAGYATSRYDDRGYGETPGDLLVDLTFDHRTDDAIAVATMVAERPDLDPGRLFAYGHSEGCSHASRVAAAVPEVDGVLMLAGLGRTFAEESPLQLVRLLGNLGYPEDVIDVYRSYGEGAVQRVLDGTYEEETWGGLSVEYARQLMLSDGAALAAAAARPTLILQGDQDFAVGPENADLLEAALLGAGVTDVTVTRYPDMGHLFTPIPEGLASFGEESMGPFDAYAEVMDEILAWLDAH